MKRRDDSFARWLKARKQPLVVSHTRPDGDAFGSLYGLLSVLTANDINALGYLGTPLPERYKELFPYLPNLYIAADPPLENIDSIICLDTATAERLDLPPGIRRTFSYYTCCNIDHHRDNSLYGDINVVPENSAATAQTVADIVCEMGFSFPVASATCFLTGIITDCGGFRFTNTDCEVLLSAITLMQKGANLPEVMDYLFFQDPYNLLQLKAFIIEKTEFAHNNRLAYVTLSRNKLEEYGVASQETEGIIDTIRSIKGVDIACLLFTDDHGIRVSLRARSVKYPVAPIARALGGGGHELAAAADLGKISLANARNIVITKTGEVLGQ